MKAAGAKILYQRSVKLRKLRYIPFIGDGDSKAYTAVKQEQPYGPAVFIPKQECVARDQEDGNRPESTSEGLQR